MRGQTPKITVAIRKRPLNKKEVQRGETDIIKVGGEGEVLISECKQKVDLTKYIEETTFRFDHAFDQHSTNENIYETTIRPLIENAFMGAKISCFAYGQTGSGKTFTMKGDVNRGVPGLYYLAAREIFNYLQHPQFQHLRVDVSFYEIYCGKLYDLLNNRTELKIREDKNSNINVIGLEEKPILSADEFLNLIEFGSTFRVTSQNATNADSSRSHAILQINLKHDRKPYSKISFIDLAGNERGADHMDQNKQTKIDGAEINKSLLSLKECIRALDQGKGHTPFRGSKLTMVLKDSFVGFCKTVMIGNVSPNISSSENTLNTLRYADRVKELKKGDNQVLNREDLHAREMMLPRTNKNCIKVAIDQDDSIEEINEKMELARRGSQTYLPRSRHILEEKMDVEPQSTRTVDFGRKMIVGRRTEDHQVLENKKTGWSRPLKSNNDIEDHGRIDQNNVNPGNNSPFSRPKSQLNRANFDSMNLMRQQFEMFKDSHEQGIKEEMTILKHEMIMKEEISSRAAFESQTLLVDQFLMMAEESAVAKMKIIDKLRADIQEMRGINRRAVQSCQHIGDFRKPIGVSNQCRPVYHMHSQSGYAEEQLLEGLGHTGGNLF